MPVSVQCFEEQIVKDYNVVLQYPQGEIVAANEKIGQMGRRSTATDVGCAEFGASPAVSAAKDLLVVLSSNGTY